MFKFYKIFTAKQKEYCGLERPIFSFRFLNFVIPKNVFFLTLSEKDLYLRQYVDCKNLWPNSCHNWPVFELASFYPSGNLDIFERYGISLYFSDNTKVCGFKISQWVFSLKFFIFLTKIQICGANVSWSFFVSIFLGVFLLQRGQCRIFSRYARDFCQFFLFNSININRFQMKGYCLGCYCRVAYRRFESPPDFSVYVLFPWQDFWHERLTSRSTQFCNSITSCNFDWIACLVSCSFLVELMLLIFVINFWPLVIFPPKLPLFSKWLK